MRTADDAILRTHMANATEVLQLFAIPQKGVERTSEQCYEEPFGGYDLRKSFLLVRIFCHLALSEACSMERFLFLLAGSAAAISIFRHHTFCGSHFFLEVV